jgi:hypothetical protein
MKIQKSSTIKELRSLQKGDYISFESIASGEITSIEVRNFKRELHFYIKLFGVKQTILIIK